MGTSSSHEAKLAHNVICVQGRPLNLSKHRVSEALGKEKELGVESRWIKQHPAFHFS